MDLSYLLHSSNSSDPPDNESDKYTMYITYDPTIIQLKTSLFAVNNRMNKLELSNTSKFADIGKQIEMSKLEM